jgi:hypothetical protein
MGRDAHTLRCRANAGQSGGAPGDAGANGRDSKGEERHGVATSTYRISVRESMY